ARLARVAPEIALVLERGEVRMDRGGRRQPDRFADLPDAGRVAALADLGIDELEHLPLAGGERAPCGAGRGRGGGACSHGGDGNTITRSGQTPVRIFP